MANHFNTNSPAVKRILKEAKELRHATDQYFASPLSESNIFEWHFTVRGPPDSDFAGGRFHGRIVLPPDYPMKPPAIYLLTPNGRFEVNKKICLTVSDYHPEHWQPSWSIRTVLLALIGFMPSEGMGAIGALDYTGPERKALAKQSMAWGCPACGACMATALAEDHAPPPLTESDLDFMRQLTFKGEKERTTSEAASAASASTSTASAAAAAAAAPPAKASEAPVPGPAATTEGVARQTSVGDSMLAPVAAPAHTAPQLPTAEASAALTPLTPTARGTSVAQNTPAPPSANAAAPREWVWNALIAVLVMLISVLVWRVTTRPSRM